MGTEKMIENVVGAVVAVKVLETGTKMLDKPLKKKRGKKRKGLLL